MDSVERISNSIELLLDPYLLAYDLDIPMLRGESLHISGNKDCNRQFFESTFLSILMYGASNRNLLPNIYSKEEYREMFTAYKRYLKINDIPIVNEEELPWN